MENQDEIKNNNIKSRRGEKGIENLKKARQARIEALQRKKEIKENFLNIDDSDSDSDSSSSSDDEPVLKIKNSKKNRESNSEVKYPFHKEKHDKLKNEVEMLKNMMLKIASGEKIKRPRTKKEPVQKVIQIMPSQSQPVKEEPKKIDDSLEQHLKRKILNF